MEERGTSYQPNLPPLLLGFTLPKGSSALTIAAVLLGSVVLSLILILTDGSIVLGLAFIIVSFVVIITMYRLDWGFYLFLAAILISDNYGVPGFSTWTFKAGYLQTLNALAPSIGIGGLTPMEIHLFFLLSVWVLRIALRRDSVREVALTVPAGLFFAWLTVATAYGIVTGGDTMKAIWEIRGLCYFSVLYFFVPQVVQTKEQIRTVMWICIGTMSFKAIQAASRFAELGFSFGPHRALAEHEDPIILATLFVLFIGLATFKSQSKQRPAIAWLSLPILLGFYAANRRAGYISVLVCVVAFVVLLPPTIQRKAFKLMTVGGILFGIYLAVYWNGFGRGAQFAQAVKAAVTKDPQSMKREDYLSGLARDQENYNLAVTLRRAPLGLGFGQKHDRAIMNYGEFSLKGYITHNQVLWLLVKAGPIGFFLFLFFMNLAIFHGAMVFSRLRDPYLMAVVAVCIIAIPNQIVATYVDMGFHRFRSMAYLGLLLALISVVKTLKSEASDETATG